MTPKLSFMYLNEGGAASDRPPTTSECNETENTHESHGYRINRKASHGRTAAAGHAARGAGNAQALPRRQDRAVLVSPGCARGDLSHERRIGRAGQDDDRGAAARDRRLRDIRLHAGRPAGAAGSLDPGQVTGAFPELTMPAPKTHRRRFSVAMRWR